VSGPGVDDPSVVGVMMGVADVVMSCEGVADVVMSREGVAGVVMSREGVAGVVMSCEGVAGVVMNVDVDVDVVVEGVAGHGWGAGQASVGHGQNGSHTSLKNCSIFTVTKANIPDKKYADPAKKTRFFLFFCYQEGLYLCVLQSNY